MLLISSLNLARKRKSQREMEDLVHLLDLPKKLSLR
jgi:hypothetical protein